MSAVRGVLRAMAMLALALGAAACGSSSSSHSSSVTSPTGQTSASAATSSSSPTQPTTGGSGCAALVAAASPRGSGSSPPLASVVHAHHLAVRSVSLIQKICVSTPTITTRSASATEVRVRPTLAARFDQRVGATRIRGRIVGGDEYLYAPGLAKHDGGRPWLRISLARAGTAVGLNLSELFNEVANLDPSRNLQILAAANQFQSLGAVTVDGIRTFEYHGVFDTRRLPSAGLSPDLAAQLLAKIRSVGATEEIVTSYVTAGGQTVRLVTALPNTARGSIYTIEDVRAINEAVSVSPPPASQTIGYQQALKLSG